MSWVLHFCLGELTYSSPFSFRRLFCVFTKLISFMLPNIQKVERYQVICNAKGSTASTNFPDLFTSFFKVYI